MSYNPNRIQRSFDKLHSIWAYLNWQCDVLDLGVKNAMHIITDKKTDVIIKAWAEKKEAQLIIETALDRSRKKWNNHGE